MRIAFISPGNSVHTRRWVEWFAGRGHRVGLVSWGELLEPPAGADLLAELAKFNRGRRGVASYRELVRSVPQVRRALKAFRPDVVNSHYLTGPAWLGWMAGVRPHVVTAWGSDILRDPAHPAVRLLHRMTLRRVAAATGDAQILLDRLVGLGAPRDRVRRVVFGVDLTSTTGDARSNAMIRTELGLPLDGPIVLAIRGVAPVQNPDTVVQAFVEVCRERPDAILAIKLTPTIPQLPPAVRGAIESSGIQDRVYVIGRLGEASLAELYGIADVCVSVPAWDGTSVSMLEAMASARAVVATDIAANREWIESGVNGILIPPRDPARLARAILDLLDSLEIRTRLGASARDTVVPAIGRDAQMEAAEALYRVVAAGGPLDP